MLDVRTLFVVIIAACLLLAASMTVAAEMRFRNGVGKWTGALMLQALMCVFYGSRGMWPDFVSIAIPNALLMLSLTLQGAAILEFYQKRLNIWWHILSPVLVMMLFGIVLDNQPVRTVLGGVIFGTTLLVLGLLVQRLHVAEAGKSDHARPARWMLVVGFVVGSFDLFARAGVTVIDPSAIKGLLFPSVFQGINFLVAYAVILVTSVGFLVLQKERAEETAQKLAVTDPLTGTFNRRTFMQLADKEISRAQRAGNAVSLIMLDLDYFKRVNDEYGHLAGDEVLKRIAEVLLAGLRREDLLVRYGGEEFCILLPDVPLDQAMLMAERLRAAVQHARFAFKGWSIPVTISLGIASMSGKGETTVQLVGRADEALYSAKRAGRNRSVAYPENSTLAMLMRSQRV